jgi:hypothetical protein
LFSSLCEWSSALNLGEDKAVLERFPW